MRYIPRNACEGGKPNPILINSGERPANYGRHNDTANVTMGEDDTCMALDAKRFEPDSKESPAGMADLAGMPLNDEKDDETGQTAGNTEGSDESVGASDVSMVNIYTAGLMIYPTTLTIKGKGSLRLSFIEGCFAWNIDMGPEAGMFIILRPVLNDGKSILLKFLGKMSWASLPVVCSTDLQIIVICHQLSCLV